MYKVRKRDNKRVEFQLARISDAIIQAFEAQNRQYNSDIIDLLEYSLGEKNVKYLGSYREA